MATTPPPPLAPHSALHEHATTAELLIRALSQNPDAVALTVGDLTLTRADMARRISQFAQEFAARGIVPGTPVAILAKSTADALLAQFAAQMRGARLTLLSASASAEDLAFILDDAEIEALIVDAAAFGDTITTLNWERRSRCQILTLGAAAVGDDVAHASRAHTPSPLSFAGRGPEGMSSIAYTGGTTGRPKGVIGTFTSAATLIQIQLSEWEWPNRPTLLLTTPLTHAGGTFVLPALLRGGRVIVLPTFNAATVLETIERERVDTMFVVPTMLYALLDAPGSFDTSSLTTVYYGAAPILPARLASAIERFGPVFFQFYGQTECGMTIAVLKRDEHAPDRLSTCGRPVPWLDVVLLDAGGARVATGEVGEVCVRGPLVAAGYWNRPEQTAETFRGEWLHTGDLGRFDADGYLTLVDRSKDVIISGGFNVYSAEVETVIAVLPNVADVAVVGVPHEYWGESVTALVVPVSGSRVDPDALVRIVRERRGTVHAPKDIVFVDVLPKTPLGKVDKAAARRLAASLLAAPHQPDVGTIAGVAN